MPPKNKDVYFKEYYLKNKEKLKEYQKDYQTRNRKVLNKRRKVYYSENKGAILERTRRWREENKEVNKLSASKSQKKYICSHKEKLTKYEKERYENDLQFRLKKILRSRLRYALRGKTKKESAVLLAGCTVSELIEHIEKQFTDGMSWSNHSFKGWHVDHIIPCACFDLTDPEQQKICFHYTNLQPLWAKDNLSKGGKEIAK